MAIRDAQFQTNTIASDRFELCPLKILGQRFNVDLTTTSTFEIYIAPSTIQAIVLGLVIEATSANTVSTPPEIVVLSSGNPILDNQALVSFDANTVWTNWVAGGKSIATSASEAVSLVVTGATATELVSNIYLLGIELES